MRRHSPLRPKRRFRERMRGKNVPNLKYTNEWQSWSVSALIISPPFSRDALDGEVSGLFFEGFRGCTIKLETKVVEPRASRGQLRVLLCFLIFSADPVRKSNHQTTVRRGQDFAGRSRRRCTCGRRATRQSTAAHRQNLSPHRSGRTCISMQQEYSEGGLAARSPFKTFRSSRGGTGCSSSATGC